MHSSKQAHSTKAMIQVRTVEPKDGEHIRNMVERFVLNHSKEWFRHLDIDACVKQGMSHGFIINETYLVIFGTEFPWFMNKPVLTEQFVGRVYRTKETLDCVVYFLEQEAIARQCCAILAGSLVAYSSRGISKLYQTHGFKQEGVQLIKVLR